MSLTKKEQQALEIIRKLSKSGFPTTIDEVKIARGSRSNNGTQRLIASLREKGFLLEQPGRIRQRAILLAPEQTTA
jgi:SOS-response transcriptional repressor LexA